MKDIKATLLYQWFEEVWNKDREEAIDAFMSNDALAHGIIADGQPQGAAGFKIFYKSFKNQFKNVRVRVDEVVSENNLECARTMVTALHRESGKNVMFSGLCMIKISNGKIAQAWNNYDFLDMYLQLGHVLMPQAEHTISQ